jgi:hypothetical protein
MHFPESGNESRHSWFALAEFPRTASMELRPMQYSICLIDLPSKRLPD